MRVYDASNRSPRQAGCIADNDEVRAELANDLSCLFLIKPIVSGTDVTRSVYQYNTTGLEH